MAVPKRRTSRANTRSRRAQWKATAPQLVSVQHQGRTWRVPRNLAPAVHRGLLDPSRFQA